MHDGPILICYDGTDEARSAINHAASLLRARRAVVLDVAPLMTLSESLAITSSAVPGNAFTDLNESDARRGAEEGAAAARMAGFDAVARTDVAEPTWQSIVDTAAEIDAPVIVTGSRGLTGMHELLEGSVSHDVASHARRPVLVVPPRKAGS